MQKKNIRRAAAKVAAGIIMAGTAIPVAAVPTEKTNFYTVLAALISLPYSITDRDSIMRHGEISSADQYGKPMGHTDVST